MGDTWRLYGTNLLFGHHADYAPAHRQWWEEKVALFVMPLAAGDKERKNETATLSTNYGSWYQRAHHSRNNLVEP